MPVLGVEVEMDGRYLTFRRLGYNLFGGLLITVPKLTLRLASVFHEMLIERDVIVGLGLKTIGMVQFSVTRASPSQMVRGQFYADMRELAVARFPPNSRPALTNTTLRKSPPRKPSY